MASIWQLKQKMEFARTIRDNAEKLTESLQEPYKSQLKAVWEAERIELNKTFMQGNDTRRKVVTQKVPFAIDTTLKTIIYQVIPALLRLKEDVPSITKVILERADQDKRGFNGIKLMLHNNELSINVYSMALYLVDWDFQYVDWEYVANYILRHLESTIDKALKNEEIILAMYDY